MELKNHTVIKASTLHLLPDIDVNGLLVRMCVQTALIIDRARDIEDLVVSCPTIAYYIYIVYGRAVTKQSFKYRDDTRKSLENGVLLCELLNGLRPGTVKRINRLPTPIAGLDNINVFLKACKSTFCLTDTHLFNPSDLEDLSQRAIAE
ncbi:LIM and calponin homology domains-containing protein 1-like [Elysia marginata]|uniref:LIM and calponin homology domains-containing protein 1-like n=1 Tax=Elysia marginata TaxID=1093978 RepID=A0AAV4EHU7_9GAST|nr:LIM and calponin homology domains-containing protein 1-like [Elysia marginata]